MSSPPNHCEEATPEAASSENRARDGFAEGASLIVRRLVSDARTGEQGVYWGDDPDPTFYDGTAGIAFFLAHATAHVALPDARELMERAVYDLLDQVGSLDSDGWMNGRLGIALAAFEAGRLHERPSLVDRSLEIAVSVEPERFSSPDVFSGPCGAILLLAYLYRRTGVQDLLERAVALSHHVLGERVGTSPYGLYLDRSGWPVLPLTGLGHGTSGLALASEELYVLTGAPVYRYVSRSAIAFEDSLYDEETNNWVDGRTSRSPLDGPLASALDAYAEDQFASYRAPLPTQRTAWCNGKPGFIVTRLRAHECNRESPKTSLRDGDVDVPARHINNATIAAPDKLDEDLGAVDNFGYCCGFSGLAESYLYAAEVLETSRYAHRARRIGDICLDRYRETGTWLAPRHRRSSSSRHGLMRGRAGVGYFLLRLAAPQSTISPLVPTRSATAYRQGEVEDLPTLDSFRSRVLRSYWSHTLGVLPDKAEQALTSRFTSGVDPVHAGDDLERFGERLAKATGEDDIAFLCFRAERDRYDFDRSMRSTVDRRFEYQLLGRPDLATQPDAVLRLQRDVEMYAVGERLLVFHLLGGTSQLSWLDGFAVPVVQQFDEPRQVGPLVRQVVEANPHLPNDRLKEKVEQLLRHLVSENVLQLTPDTVRRSGDAS